MKLKQTLFAAATLLLSASGFGATYAVWPAATEGEVQIPNEFNWWWNLGNEVVTADGRLATKCWSDNGSDSASSGWITYETDNFDFSLLADKDLVFDAKIEGPGQWNIRLTSPGTESDVTVAVPADGEFHTVRINVAEGWPGVAAKWASGAANGQTVFTWSVVGSNLTSESTFYFANVRYKDAIAQPKVTAEVTNITETSATLSWDTTFPEGYTNTKVMVDGVAQSGTSMELNGLTPNTAYSHTITAEGEMNGETYTATTTVNFKTAREAGTNPTWHGVTDKEGFSAVYSITYNNDKTLTVEAEIETEKETPVADRNFHIFIGGDEWLKLYDDGTGMLTGTTTSTFEEGSTITWEWYLPYAGGVYQEANQYVVGSENEAPRALRIKATAENITFEGAEIAYEVTAPANSDYKVYYAAAGGEAILATTNPIVIGGLAERTEYSYEVYAVMGEGDDKVESSHVTVTFKTTAQDALDLIYSDLVAAEFKNAFLPGENEQTDRRSFFVTLPWKVVYATDGTATYSVDLSEVKDLVGLVPQIYWNGFQTLTAKGEGIYEYNFGAQELEAGTAISHYFAYSGGVVDLRTPYTNWGMEKEAPSVGEAVSLTLNTAKKAAKIEENIRLTVVAKDAQNYYLPADGVEFEVEGGSYTIVNSVFAAKSTGTYTITAKSGNLSASADIAIIASAGSENIIAGKTGVTDTENIQSGTVENVTDSDLNSQLEWKCGDTEEHYLIYDLGGDYWIEGIDLLFEGAYATEFTITLSNTTPDELAMNAPAAIAAQENEKSPQVVFTNEKSDTQHYFTQTPTGTHRYVALRTSKALNTGWGIKVRDLKVYGAENNPTGVVGVATDNNDVPTEYYNLQGVRVSNPGAGIYICRKGNKATKVIIK